MKIADVSWECLQCHRIGRFRVFGDVANYISPSAIAKQHMQTNADCAMAHGAKHLSWTIDEGELEWPK